MVKPFEFKELLLKIRSLLKRTMNQSLPVGNVLKASDLEMNLDVTRTTLAKKIDEVTNTNERLSRLEKLNNQLSMSMTQTIQN